MKLRIKRILMTACMAVIALMSSAQNEAMTNETVLELLKEGFSSEEIIGAIENSTERKITYSIDFMRLVQNLHLLHSSKRLPRPTLAMSVYFGGTRQEEESLRKCSARSLRRNRRALTWVLLP